MSAAARVRRAIRRAGVAAEIVSGGKTVSAKCFIQPMRYKNKMYIDSQYTKLGIVDESCFLYLGPPEYPLSEGTDTAVKVGGVAYNCVKTETVLAGTQAAYTWAILRLRR